MIQQILNHLNNPPMEFRGVPFWSWNGTLEETELRRQIRVMKEMGFGGFFMHSRLGLATEYLSEEWFRLVNVCIDEAEKLGIILAVENSFPAIAFSRFPITVFCPGGSAADCHGKICGGD